MDKTDSPQGAAGPEEAILEFQGEYRFLSNFWPAMVYLDDAWYSTVEHAYQAAKTLDLSSRVKIALCLGPGQAKRVGHQVALRSDWNKVRLTTMKGLINQKFENEEMKNLLLSTGTREIVEGNTWGDTFWGVCRGQGENNLGKIIMSVREEIRLQEKKYDLVP